MKTMILAACFAVAVTAGIASAGIASLADGATILISATDHSGPFDNTACGFDGRYIGGAGGNLPLAERLYRG